MIIYGGFDPENLTRGMIISKELLCEVLDIDERLCRLDKLIDNTLFFYTLNNTGEYQHYINIYEFAHKCKQWAFEKGFSLESAKKSILRENKMISEWVSCGFTPNYEVMPTFYSETEPEAICKAAQYVYDNLSNS